MLAGPGRLCLIALSTLFLREAQPVSAQAPNLFNQLVEQARSEMAKSAGKITASFEWPSEEAKPVLEAFRKDFPFIKETIFERSRTSELMLRFLMEYKAGRAPKFDILKVTAEVWPQYENAGLFVRPPFPYKEVVKSLPQGWTAPDPRIIDPKGYFVATTGLARGIAYNKNLVPPDKAPTRWEDCLNPMWRGKFLYDPRPVLIALQHDPKTREAHLKWLRGIVDNKPIFYRGQTENVEKVAGGEFPLFCNSDYHGAMRMIDQGAPVGFVFPDPVPLYFGTQFHILKWSKTPATAQLFALWLATKAQPLVEKHAYRGFPWDPSSRKYPLAKGKYIAICDVDCQKKSEEYISEHAKILKLPGAR